MISHVDERKRARAGDDDELFLVGSGAFGSSRAVTLNGITIVDEVSEANASRDPALQTHEAGWAIRKHSAIKKYSKVRAKRKTAAGEASRT